MTEGLERLKRKRATIRAATTRLLTRLEDEVGKERPDTDKLREFLAVLSSKEDSLLDLDKGIEDVTSTDDLDTEISSTLDYMDRVLTWKVRATTAIGHQETIRDTPRVRVSDGSSGSFTSQSRQTVKLPKLMITKYDGEISQWQEFWSQYETAIHRNEVLCKTDKFTYLRSYLTGAAARTIAGLTMTDANYDAAIELLQSRFGRKDIVISAHMSKLLNLNPVKRSSDVTALRHLYDECEIQIRSLESLGVQSDTYGCLLCPVLLQLIPEDIALAYTRQPNATNEWKVPELIQFLQNEVQSRERALQLTRPGHASKDPSPQHKNVGKPSYACDKPRKWSVPSATALHTASAVPRTCVYCDSSDHKPENCSDHTVSARKDKLRKLGRCYVCLGPKHIAKYCRVKVLCSLCNRKHHLSVCEQSEAKLDINTTNSSENTEAVLSSLTSPVKVKTNTQNTVLLQTVKTWTVGPKERKITRCLLDGGSQRSFIHRNVVRALGLPVVRQETLNLHVFGSTSPVTEKRNVVRVELQNMWNTEQRLEIEAVETPQVCSAVIKVPSEPIQAEIKKRGLQLADFPLEGANDQELQVLIGADYYWQAVTGKVQKVTNSLVAVESIFGWALQGPVTTSSVTETTCMHISLTEETQISKQLHAFWEVESLGIVNKQAESREDSDILQSFEQTTTFENGRYQVELPWRSDKDQLPDNFKVAKRRFESLMRKLKTDAALYARYNNVIQDYLQQGICEEVLEDKTVTGNQETVRYYMPHHAVVREDKATTKLRVVFDASSHDADSPSLNDCLHTGPNLNPNLLEVLITFRLHEIAFTADITKAFLQISLAEKDKDAVRFLWMHGPPTKDCKNEVCVLRMNRVVFGVSPSPFLLAATIRKHLKLFDTEQPKAAQILSDSLYVDDFISSSPTVQEALHVTTTAKDILAQAGMDLCKWVTNSPDLRAMWKETGVELTGDTESCGNVLKVLGLVWRPERDDFVFDQKGLIDILRDKENTKRSVLQTSARIFDPIGFLTPFTIRVKCLFQEMWERGLSWDEPLPIDLTEKWEQWCMELPLLHLMAIPRWYHIEIQQESHTVKLHVYCDASEKAYSAVAYLQGKNKQGETVTSFVASKSRVAPLKKMTLPRLELMGALIGARLGHSFLKPLNMEKSQLQMWTDSMITLHWIRSSAQRWKPFVANRVTEIQGLTNPETWSHCAGKMNPADLPTRGQHAQSLIESQLWWSGPASLSTAERELDIDDDNVVNEVLYFHTSLRLPSTVVVLELVSLSPRPDGSQQALGRGFAVLELFTNRPEAQAADGDRRLNLHHGSPRSLLHPLVKATDDYSSLLTTIDGAHLDCAVKNHQALVSVMHLLPENVLISGKEKIPGLAASPTGDSLLRPQPLKMLPFTLHRLTISLQPSLEKFESQLLQLINDDCRNTKQPGSEAALRTVVIQERRLLVGVHNGWCFLDKPQVVVLEAAAAGSRGRADSASKQSAPVKDRSALSTLPHTLGLRGSLELKLTNHHALAIVFQLEWVFSAPMGRETMLSAASTSRAAFLQCLRWGAWCPFRESADWKGEEIQLVLQGGARPNPHAVMVYRTEMSAKAQSPAPLSAPGSAQAKDTITFRLSSAPERKASSPKASLRTKREDESRRRRSPSSPSQGQKNIQPTSPPESPQGPGLSLSQLAATSRYPTISHSSSALPWQQSFPSLLHPSPLASAHQLSHVACSGVGNIAHLEMDLHREGDGPLSAQDEGDQLQELPFTPVHAPVITLGVSMPSSSSVGSRSSLAHLYSAGFPDIVDSAGQAAEVLDPTEPVPFDPQREESDPLQGNLLVFQFLAFNRIPTAGVAANWPENIHFTFQFYRFPPVTSQQLKLLTSDKVQQQAAGPLPCVLASINKDGTFNSASPGLQVQFRVDSLKPGERRWFLRYLALHTMHIDVWDSDSLLLIGSTAVELKYMLRQGKSAVQALHEVEVLTTDYLGDDTLLTSTDVGLRPARTPMSVHTIIRGRLHIRTGNIGCPVDPSSRRATDVMASHLNIITPRGGSVGFRGGSLSSRNTLQLNGRNAAQAPGPEMEAQPNLNGPDGRRRKLDCMAAVRRREGTDEPKVTDRTTEARFAREPHQIKPSGKHSEAEAIGNMLSRSITTQHLLYAGLGAAEYMEFVLKNPFNVPQTVTIHSDDPELSVITTTEEWAYFKALTETPTPLEENMFHLEEGAPGPKVYLRPRESIHIPLKYQSFLCDHTVALQGPSFQPTHKGSQVAKRNLSNIVAAKPIKVTFSAEDGKPMAICQLNVEPTPHVVDQTFRLYHPELSFLKKAIRLPPWNNPEAVGDPDVRTHISVRCSDPNVICQTRMLAPGEPQDVYLKVPGSPSPHIKMFFVMVFTDRWMAAPSQIWQIYVHFLERVDVSCVTGQRSCQSLVLRGKQAVRKVKCFSSHPQEIQVDPAGVFLLPPAALQELQLKLQPWRAGSRFLYVNAVDVEQRRLVTAWLLCLNVHRPVLSKAFEVCVPVCGGRGSSRKITYTNPYSSSRAFLLRSDHPDLLQFKEEKFQISGGETYTIGLRFAPSQSAGSVEILVYVNNLEEKTEETFCVKVNYS